ncbi:hypothetical protein NDU88_003904 [Pleurodeles waltl]|uniref:Uncharacterized protein n=1 Tax=Pleurodeles waltl TaxID=8319 RepID=A0AAV7SH88_PLEWA|nr:hypothetical protein NDU88_003904 [Pleurodeles waltl]
MEVLLLAALTPLAPIDFYLSGSTDIYLDLNNTLLHIICKIVKVDGSNIANNAEVVMISYLIPTMFNQVDITLGDWLITQSDNMKAYRAFTESSLNYSHDALDTPLSAGLFYKDTYCHFEDTALDGHNKGFVKRANFAAGSRQFDLQVRVHSDHFYQDKLPSNGINLKTKLTRNKDLFFFINGDAEQYKLVRQFASKESESVTKCQTGSCRGPTAIKYQVCLGKSSSEDIQHTSQ